MRCISELQLEYIFLEVDHAIYNKVLQVLFNQKARDPSFCNKLIVRMGCFHIVLCLLKKIYNRFYDSGIVELLFETGVGSEGSIRSAMKGSDVTKWNRVLQNSVRGHSSNKNRIHHEECCRVQLLAFVQQPKGQKPL